MDDALIQTKRRFAEELVPDRKGDIEPLVADQWVVVSLLQKSIRRGEVQTAQRAAFTLFAQSHRVRTRPSCSFQKLLLTSMVK
jgi:hypothetical protein